MSPSKPTIVIIPGGWHTPSSYSKLQTTLKAAGFTVHVITLASVSESRPPKADLSTDTALVRSFVENLLDEGQTVAVLMHSYSGQVGTNALYSLGPQTRKTEGKKGGISHLVYMTAIALTEGGAMIDKVREFGHEEYMPLAFDFADDRSCLPRDPSYLIGATPGVPQEEVDVYAKALVTTRWNGECMYQKIERAAWRDEDVRVAYVFATKDTCVPIDYQKSFVEGLRREGKEVGTWELETGHCPNFTAVEGVVRVLGEIVA